MDTRRRFVSGLGLGLAGAWSAAESLAAPPAPGAAAVPGQVPLTAPNANIEHLRRDEVELTKIGNGSLDKGMTALGQIGYELMAVTSILDTGAAGFHLFKRQPAGTPLNPGRRYEHRRLDAAAIEQLADAGAESPFDAGLRKLEAESWELKAVTQTLQGNVGFYYFQRETPR